MLLTVVTPPAEEPVSLEDAKLHLRVDASDDDPMITALITAARQWCEAITARAFVTTTFRATYPGFPGTTGALGPSAYGVDPLVLAGGCLRGSAAMRYALRLPRPSVREVTAFTYLDSDGTVVAVDEAAYVLASSDVQAFLTPAPSSSWPCAQLHPEAVSVEFIAGYGGDAADVPRAIAQAILLLVGHFYENREAVSVSRFTPAEVPVTVDALLGPYRVLEAV